MLIVAGGGPAQPLQGAIVALRLCKELARPRCVGLTPLTTNAEWRLRPTLHWRPRVLQTRNG